MLNTITFFVIFLTLFSVFWMAQWYIFRRYRQWTERTIKPARRKWANRLLLAVLFAGNVLFFAKYAISNVGLYEYGWLQWATAYPGGMFFASVVTATLILVLLDVSRAVSGTVGRVRKLVSLPAPRVSTPAALASRRRFLRTAGIGVIGAAVGAPAISVASSSRDYEIKRIALRFAGLPSGLEGLTIAQVSDFHSGVFMDERPMRDVFEIVNSLHPQLVAVTGDFVDRADSEIPPVHRAIRMLKSEYGVFGCLGNHDHFATGELVSAALEDAGLVMLNNANRELMINGDRLVVAGIDDMGGGRYRSYADFGRAAEGLRPDAFSILLAHQPRAFDTARQAGIDLTLSGHTHGGQIAFNVLGVEVNPIALIHEYPKGLFEVDGKMLYVNSGVGMVGVPVRLVPPEITLITLRSA